MDKQLTYNQYFGGSIPLVKPLSRLSSIYAFVAQQVEQLPCKEKVAGSIPVKGSNKYLHDVIGSRMRLRSVVSEFESRWRY